MVVHFPNHETTLTLYDIPCYYDYAAPLTTPHTHPIPSNMHDVALQFAIYFIVPSLRKDYHIPDQSLRHRTSSMSLSLPFPSAASLVSTSALASHFERDIDART